MTTSRIADDPRKICPVCGKEFTPGTSKQIYCSQSCGARSRRAVDPAEIVGQRNGKCTVIGPAEPDRFGHSRIMLRCDCGEEFPASLTAWVRRHTPAMCRKCSGLRGMKPERDRTGERIGSLTILKNCYIEPFAASMPALSYLQFQRIGYFNVDPDSTQEHPVFNKTVGLRS